MAATVTHFHAQRGFSLVEAVVTMIVMALLLSAFSVMAQTALETRHHARERERLVRDAGFAMQRMIMAVRETSGLMLPLRNNPSSPQNEALREQRVPPDVGKEDRSAVLAVRLTHGIDRDRDGIADADNDADGRVDEDPGGDVSNDSEAGIVGIDDDHDGATDEKVFGMGFNDDDEDGSNVDEDAGDLVDDDGDLSVDEDPPGDLNNDGEPGLAGVDDDGDGRIDEGSAHDDDEDGTPDEDWYDLVVFYLVGDELIERSSFPFDFDGDGEITGRDYVETVIAEGVTHFRVERLERARSTVVDISFELRGAGEQRFSITTRARVGGRT